MHWLWFYGGLSSGNSPWYLFPSGWGSILVPPLLTAAPIVWVLARKHNCHEPRCWRIGRYPVAGTPWSACRRHHPEPPRRGSIRKQYHLYAGKQPGRG